MAVNKTKAVTLHSTGLANTFRRIAAEAERLDDTANHILQVVATMTIRDVTQFDPLVREAYEKNGWNTRPGRPSGEAEAAPAIIRTYVSEVRAAFRLDLKVHTYKSFYALRQAIRETRERLAAETAAVERWPALRGVQISAPDKLNGAPFHDLVVIYDHLDEEAGEALERAITRLVNKYKKLAGELPETETPHETARATA